MKKVRRVFWIHHILAGEDKGKFKKATDFPDTLSHDEVCDLLWTQHGKHDGTAKESFKPFAEIISSVVTDEIRAVDPSFQAPKHFGTDCIFGGVEWAKIEVNTAAKKRRTKKIV